MKSTGIIMSQPMMIADLSGKKFQTRRTRGLNKINESPDDWGIIELRKQQGMVGFINNKNAKLKYIKCPYGGIGDEIYLKETWYADKQYDLLKPSLIPISSLIGYKAGDVKPDWGGITRSAMFMPKWASRRKHILTDIRCERVKQITACDCVKEGLSTKFREHDAKVDLVEQYSKLWDSLNGKKYPWNKNNWVFVLEWLK